MRSDVCHYRTVTIDHLTFTYLFFIWLILPRRVEPHLLEHVRLQRGCHTSPMPCQMPGEVLQFLAIHLHLQPWALVHLEEPVPRYVVFLCHWERGLSVSGCFPALGELGLAGCQLPATAMRPGIAVPISPSTGLHCCQTTQSFTQAVVTNILNLCTFLRSARRKSHLQPLLLKHGFACSLTGIGPRFIYKQLVGQSGYFTSCPVP
mmetsp:Transcript_10070/g.13129  ORF Transcript_10070/g.13129 Transcript_10070/m.13129 type:complete len:205 (-) Transcript_10070:1361-1975(-)